MPREDLMLARKEKGEFHEQKDIPNPRLRTTEISLERLFTTYIDDLRSLFHFFPDELTVKNTRCDYMMVIQEK